MNLLGSAIITPDNKWFEMNDAVCEILGYSKAELKEMTWQDLTHEDDRRFRIEQLCTLSRKRDDSDSRSVALGRDRDLHHDWTMV